MFSHQKLLAQYLCNHLIKKQFHEYTDAVGVGRSSPNDFVEDFSRDQIENALSGLCREGKIRRVCRGIYDYPKFSELLQQDMSPDFDQVAQAFARKFNWRIQPSGDAALNLLGLSTQVPGRLVYLSDGPNRQYDIGNYTLEFKKSALKDVGFKYRESGLIVQALKALGAERVDKSVIATLRKQLDETACKRVLKDTVTATAGCMRRSSGFAGSAADGIGSRACHPPNGANCLPKQRRARA